MKKSKVLIIFPKYQADDATHYPYWYKVFQVASSGLDLAILFESGQEPIEIKGVSSAKIQRFQLKPINLIERFFLLLVYIFQGYNHIYIHYSLFSFILVWLLRPIFGLKLFLWDCELYEKLPTNKLLVWAIKQTDVLVTGSNIIGENYCQVFELGDKPIKIVANYVEPLNVRPRKLDRSNQHILFVHHLSPRKGSRELPAIIDQVLNNQPNVIFHIVGDGPDFHWLQEQTKKHKKSVKFYGKKPPEFVASLMKACDIFIMPSKAEGFPRVILEAMTYGLPYVSFDVGNVSELGGRRQRECVVKPGDKKAFATKTIQLLNRIDRQKLIAQNKARVKKYNLERSSKEFVELFN